MSKKTTVNKDLMTLDWVPVGRLRVSGTAFQAERRRRRSADKLAALAESIGQIGVIEPLVVRPLSDDADAGLLEIVCGEGRYLGAQQQRVPEVAVIIRRDLDDAAVIALQVEENVKREDVSPIEQGVAAWELKTRCALSEVQVAARLGLQQPQVNKLVRLHLELDGDCREAVARREVTINTAVLLMRVPTGRLRDEALAGVLSPEFHPGQPMSEREADVWLRRHFVEPLEEKEKWDAREAELLGLFGQGAERLTFEECWPHWDRGAAQPKYDSPWRLADEPLPDEVRSKVGLAGGIWPGATWGAVAQKMGLPIKVARDGRGSPVAVVPAEAVLAWLREDFVARVEGFAASLGVSGATARTLVSRGDARWLAWNGVEGVSEERSAPGEVKAETETETEAGTDDDEEAGEDDDDDDDDEHLMRERVGSLARRIAAVKPDIWLGDLPRQELLEEAAVALAPGDFDGRGVRTPGQAAAFLARVYLLLIEDAREREATVARWEEVFGE